MREISAKDVVEYANSRLKQLEEKRPGRPMSKEESQGRKSELEGLIKWVEPIEPKE